MVKIVVPATAARYGQPSEDRFSGFSREIRAVLHLPGVERRPTGRSAAGDFGGGHGGETLCRTSAMLHYRRNANFAKL